MTGLLLAVSVQAVQLMLRNNFHAVVPGRFYRCAQPGVDDLREAIRKHGIRTVVNLRGVCQDMPFYLNECRIVHEAGASQVDVGFSAGRLPPVHELRHLVRALDRSEPPVLFHCRQGVDRTGLVSVLVLLLYTDTDLKEARRQLALRYGHITIGRTRYMNAFFDLYEDWLAQQGQSHAPEHLRRWIEKEYSAGASACRLEPVEVPRTVALHKPWAARVRAHNTSAKPWQFRAGTGAGIHVTYLLIDDQGRGIAMGRAGLFNAIVPPGESIAVTVPLPPLREAGTYTLMIDMVDEQHGQFFQAGSEPLFWEFQAGQVKP